jgi:hypothetical protein
MRRGVVVLAAGAAVVLVAASGFYAYGQREYTNCYATFKTEESAERAAESLRDAGFDAEIDSPGSVTFSSGETGADAREFRGKFHEVLRRERGAPAHPDGGCLERQFFE